MIKQSKIGKRILRRIGKTSVSILTALLTMSPALAADIELVEAANQAIGSEGGKKMTKEILKTASSKPSMTLAIAIVYSACFSPASAVTSLSLYLACAILITKTFG